MTDDMGSAIGSLIGLGIGIVIAKKLTDEIKGSASSGRKKKKPMAKAKDWVSQETGDWS